MGYFHLLSWGVVSFLAGSVLLDNGEETLRGGGDEIEGVGTGREGEEWDKEEEGEEGVGEGEEGGFRWVLRWDKREELKRGVESESSKMTSWYSINVWVSWLHVVEFLLACSSAKASVFERRKHGENIFEYQNHKFLNEEKYNFE